MKVLEDLSSWLFKRYFGFFSYFFKRADLRNVDMVAGLVIVRLHSQTAQVVRVFGPADSRTRLTRYLQTILKIVCHL